MATMVLAFPSRDRLWPTWLDRRSRPARWDVGDLVISKQRYTTEGREMAILGRTIVVIPPARPPARRCLIARPASASPMERGRSFEPQGPGMISSLSQA